ncbi:hypothetical protein J6590_036921 [Homalodisca vitripennis]|nr:hypothetical protein J6590_036921 [Homalodisca vitripennis]
MNWKIEKIIKSEQIDRIYETEGRDSRLSGVKTSRQLSRHPTPQMIGIARFCNFNTFSSEDLVPIPQNTMPQLKREQKQPTYTTSKMFLSRKVTGVLLCGTREKSRKLTSIVCGSDEGVVQMHPASRTGSCISRPRSRGGAASRPGPTRRQLSPLRNLPPARPHPADTELLSRQHLHFLYCLPPPAPEHPTQPAWHSQTPTGHLDLQPQPIARSFQIHMLQKFPQIDVYQLFQLTRGPLPFTAASLCDSNKSLGHKMTLIYIGDAIQEFDLQTVNVQESLTRAHADHPLRESPHTRSVATASSQPCTRYHTDTGPRVSHDTHGQWPLPALSLVPDTTLTPGHADHPLYGTCAKLAALYTYYINLGVSHDTHGQWPLPALSLVPDTTLTPGHADHPLYSTFTTHGQWPLPALSLVPDTTLTPGHADHPLFLEEEFRMYRGGGRGEAMRQTAPVPQLAAFAVGHFIYLSDHWSGQVTSLLYRYNLPRYLRSGKFTPELQVLHGSTLCNTLTRLIGVGVTTGQVRAAGAAELDIVQHVNTAHWCRSDHWSGQVTSLLYRYNLPRYLRSGKFTPELQVLHGSTLCNTLTRLIGVGVTTG